MSSSKLRLTLLSRKCDDAIILRYKDKYVNKPSKPKPNHYVSNKKFFDELVKYRSVLKECRETGQPLPPIPNYIGECLMLIAKRLSNKPNFFNYSHKDEMISDGIENSVRYLELFDPARSSNPFAYFTQTIKNAFIRRIQNEKKQLYLKEMK